MTLRAPKGMAHDPAAQAHASGVLTYGDVHQLEMGRLESREGIDREHLLVELHNSGEFLIEIRLDPRARRIGIQQEVPRQILRIGTHEPHIPRPERLHQPSVPGSPLNGPTSSGVTQPP